MLRDPRGPSLLHPIPSLYPWNLKLWPERDPKVWPLRLELLQVGTQRKESHKLQLKSLSRLRLSASYIKLVSSHHGALWQPGSSLLLNLDGHLIRSLIYSLTYLEKGLMCRRLASNSLGSQGSQPSDPLASAFSVVGLQRNVSPHPCLCSARS